jgi:hypothetical protein
MFVSFDIMLIWLPLTLVFIVSWVRSEQKLYGYLLLGLWAIPFLLWGVARLLYPPKMNVKRADIFGTYVIDRSHYAVKQADWQYDHFKFKISEPDKFTFYVMEKDSIAAFYEGKIKFSEQYPRRFALELDTPRHHLLEENPILYRKPYSFYYVFHSKKLGNVFFTKKKWWQF